MFTSDLSLVGQRVKRLRELRGMSVGEVCSKSGVSIMDISTLEAGTEDTGVVTIGRIVAALDGSTDEILTE